MSDGDSTISQAADAVEQASNHPALDVLARAGFAVMALLHVIIGAIAVAVAFGQPGKRNLRAPSSSWPRTHGARR